MFLLLLLSSWAHAAPPANLAFSPENQKLIRVVENQQNGFLFERCLLRPPETPESVSQAHCRPLSETSLKAEEMGAFRGILQGVLARSIQLSQAERQQRIIAGAGQVLEAGMLGYAAYVASHRSLHEAYLSSLKVAQRMARYTPIPLAAAGAITATSAVLTFLNAKAYHDIQKDFWSLTDLVNVDGSQPMKILTPQTMDWAIQIFELALDESAVGR